VEAHALRKWGWSISAIARHRSRPAATPPPDDLFALVGATAEHPLLVETTWGGVEAVARV
jgi:hypothetical protein